MPGLPGAGKASRRDTRDFPKTTAAGLYVYTYRHCCKQAGMNLSGILLNSIADNRIPPAPPLLSLPP